MITKKKLVDIFIPYWGDVDLLKEAVNSVLSQTSDDFNLIVVDDHYPSTEAQKFYKNNKKLIFHRHDKNFGITKNFNFCLKSAKSKYVVIMGCDDIMHPNYVENLAKNHQDADLYQPRVKIIDKNSNRHFPLADRVKSWLRPKDGRLVSGEKLARSLAIGNWLYFPSIAWKTETAQKYKFDEKYKIVEDLDLEFNIILNGGKIFLDGAETFSYRRFDESLSSQEKTGIRFQEEKELYEKFAKKFTDKGWSSAARAAKFRPTSRLNSLLSRLGL